MNTVEKTMIDSVFTSEQLKDVFLYKEGMLYWKDRAKRRIKKQGQASWLGKNGYYYVSIGKQKFKQARLIWIMFNGGTDKFIDHINNVSTDDRIENLREATPAENMYNRRRFRISSTGYRGVSYCKFTGRYVGEVRAQGKRVFFGRFDTPEEANNACIKAREQYHGSFVRHD